MFALINARIDGDLHVFARTDNILDHLGADRWFGWGTQVSNTCTPWWRSCEEGTLVEKWIPEKIKCTQKEHLQWHLRGGDNNGETVGRAMHLRNDTTSWVSLIWNASNRKCFQVSDLLWFWNISHTHDKISWRWDPSPNVQSIYVSCPLMRITWRQVTSCTVFSAHKLWLYLIVTWSWGGFSDSSIQLTPNKFWIWGHFGVQIFRLETLNCKVIVSHQGLFWVLGKHQGTKQTKSLAWWNFCAGEGGMWVDGKQ